jgi:hypothetical protein
MEMRDFFFSPKTPLQKQYEALRAFYVDKLSEKKVLKMFRFSKNYFKKLRFQVLKQLKQGVDPFFIVKRKGPKERFTSKSVIQTIIAFRKKNYSIEDIQSALNALGEKLSLYAIDSILKGEGFAPLPRRTKNERVATLKPEKLEAPESISLKFDDETFSTEKGVAPLIFLPIMEELNIVQAIKDAHFPGTSQISAISSIMSFLALKIIGNERVSHDQIWNLDRSLGLFAGLNVLPKTATLSSYSYRVTRKMNYNFLKSLSKIFCSSTGEFNLDFKAIPHWGDDSVLEKNWIGSKCKAMKSVLALLVHDPESGYLSYSDAETKHKNHDSAIIEFVDFWKQGSGNVPKMLIFDSKLTTYENLFKLENDQIKFLTLRRRGKKLEQFADSIPEKEWKKVKIDSAKRKYPEVTVYENKIALRGYDKEIRQIIIKDNGRKKPTFLITNDFTTDLKTLITKYARRCCIEKEISEQIVFFHLNKLSASVVVKVDFDLTMTLLAHNLYVTLTKKIPGFEDCTVPTIFRKFLDNSANVTIEDRNIIVYLKKKTHLPILFETSWLAQKTDLSWMNTSIQFKIGTTS